MPQLQDSSHTTCVKPLKGEAKSARITIKSENPIYNKLRVLLVVSPQTRCYSPGITVAAKPCGSEIMVECSLLDENNSPLITCAYLCNHLTELEVIHVVYKSLNTKGINNILWELCEIKVWALGWRCWKWPIGNINTLEPRQDGRRFPDDIFKWIFLNEIIWISIKISLKFAPMGPINNIPALVQIMAWRRPGNKPLSEAMMVSFLTHICVTRPQWVNINWVIKAAAERSVKHLVSGRPIFSVMLNIILYTDCIPGLDEHHDVSYTVYWCYYVCSVVLLEAICWKSRYYYYYYYY